MKGKDLEIGTRIWENVGSETYTAGRVVSLSDSVNDSNVIYALLMSDEGEYTVYSVEKNFDCKPRLTRKVPGENFEDLVRVAMTDIELPEEKVKKPRKKPLVTVIEDSQPTLGKAEVPVSVKSHNNALTTVDVDGEEVEFSEIIMGFDVTMEVV